jgi:hypothetical protein
MRGIVVEKTCKNCKSWESEEGSVCSVGLVAIGIQNDVRAKNVKAGCR